MIAPVEDDSPVDSALIWRPSWMWTATVLVLTVLLVGSWMSSFNFVWFVATGPAIMVLGHLPGQLLLLAALVALPCYLAVTRHDVGDAVAGQLIGAQLAALAVGALGVGLAFLLRAIYERFGPFHQSAGIVAFWVSELVIVTAACYYYSVVRNWLRHDQPKLGRNGIWAAAISMSAMIVAACAGSGLTFCALLFCG